ncbi:hypothetical protein [Pseudoalteromonas phenolica]|uniref:hypothetical protein n=1 Tax=Pseudoalteromonas phenolica TaxID=161398 RepID=UPI00384CE755|tara:strand:+ start:1125 stop:1724 length:600 start_codon:yes stop_codon:yes gene_type:complete
MNAFTTLKTQPAANLTFATEQLPYASSQKLLEGNEPALQLMRNLILNPIQHIDLGADIDEASLILNRTHHKVSFVVDAQNNIVGLISNARIGSRYILTIADRLNCHRKDLNVGDIMIPIKSLQQISFKQVEQSNVSNLVKTMEQSGADFLLVIDDTNSSFVGYFDFIDLAKICGANINTVKPANKFSDIVDTLLHHAEI